MLIISASNVAYINKERVQTVRFQDTYRIQITKDYEDYDTVQ